MGSLRSPAKVLLAPQELKGTLTASEAVLAIVEGLRAAVPLSGDRGAADEIDSVALADGGPGTIDALVAAAGEGAEVRVARVRDALGREVHARWALLPGAVAIVEMAEAAGLWRISSTERTEANALGASTFGVGELIREALEAGASRVLVGAGGSATTDGGRGTLEALGATVREDGDRWEVDLCGLVGVDAARLEVMTDVRHPLLGPLGAARVFGPQKGLATVQSIAIAEERLRRWAEALERATGRAGLSEREGSGAAGGLAFGLACAFDAAIRSGFEAVADAVRLRERLARCEVVLTAEGRLDAQTAHGKGPAALAQLAAEAGVPCVLFAGSVAEDADTSPFAEVVTVAVREGEEEAGLPSPAAARARLVEAARAWRVRAS